MKNNTLELIKIAIKEIGYNIPFVLIGCLFALLGGLIAYNIHKVVTL